MRALHIRFLLAFHFFTLGGFSSSGESKDKLFYDAVRAEASGDLVKAIEIYYRITEREILPISMQTWPTFILKPKIMAVRCFIFEKQF